MIVVADSGPLQYLVLIEAIDVLKALFERVVIPEMVAKELSRPRTPSIVRSWIEALPSWCSVMPDQPLAGDIESLGPGELAAIALAVAINADRILMDDRDGRAEAERRRLRVTGTLGVLAEAHKHGLLDFENSLARLRRTNFYCSEALVGQIRREFS